MKKILCIISCYAEYNTYKILLDKYSQIIDSFVLLDITSFTNYSVDTQITGNYVKVEHFSIKFLPLLVNNLINIIYLKRIIRRLHNNNQFTHVIMGTDQEIYHLTIINYFKNTKTKSVVFQHGLYLLEEQREYEFKYTHKRFNKFFKFIYSMFRNFLSFVGILPLRRPYGLNNADEYWFFSKYYANQILSIPNYPKHKVKIVEAVKYSSIDRKNVVKKNAIVYASFLFEKYFPFSKISDVDLFSIILENIPPNYTLYIKPHPSEKKSDYEKVLAGILSENYILFNPSDKVEDLLEESQALIVYFSSVIYDAILLDNIVFKIDVGEEYSLKDNELYSLTIDDIVRGKIAKVLFSETLKREIFIRQKIFIAKHLGEDLKSGIQNFISNLNLN